MTHKPQWQKIEVSENAGYIKLELAKLMHRSHNGLLPSVYNSLFQRSSDLLNYATRYANIQNYFIPSVSSRVDIQGVQGVRWTPGNEEKI